ncbi:MAG: YraN family protein [Puniceicoccales bacterium]|nr:YraN family protein [Puniceicoccales bacterium]
MNVFRWFWAKLWKKSRNIGIEGEILACRFIKKQGYSIIARNWRFGRGEIDIVARDNNVLVFIEVRLRSKGASVRGYESILKRKKIVLRQTCFAYLKRCVKEVPTYRFDVIDIEHDYGGNVDVVHHYENVPFF